VLDVIINTIKTDYPNTDMNRPFTDNKVLYCSAKVLGSAVAQYRKKYITEKMFYKNNVIPSFGSHGFNLIRVTASASEVCTVRCILHFVIVFPLAVQAQTVQVPGPAVAQQQAAAATAVAASVPQMIPAPERAILPVVSMAPAPTPLPLQTALPIPANIQQCTPLAPTVSSPNMIVTSTIPQIQSVSPQQQAPQMQPQLQTQVSTAEEELAC